MEHEQAAEERQVGPSREMDDEASKYITEAIDNNIWRKAISVDGKTYWATDKEGELGEPVKGRFKFLHYGGYMLLAPSDGSNEEDPEYGAKIISKLVESIRRPPGAYCTNETRENDARFNAFIERTAEKLWLYLSKGEIDETPDGGPRQLTEERMQRILNKAADTIVRFRQASGANDPEGQVPMNKALIKAALMTDLNDHLADLLVDGILIKDIHGRLDLDFDNYGPELVSEPQAIDQGVVAWQARGEELEQRKFHRARVRVFLPINSRTADQPDDGYESDTSQISQEHCRESPYYPPCEETCWLRNLTPELDTTVEEPEPAASPPFLAKDFYKTLEPGCIRLLVLRPGSGDDDISCDLEPRHVSDPTLGFDFEALSYAWGDPKPTHSISCNGSALFVATNLYHALRHLRLPDSPRRLWIDAICINQNDIEERNSQIQFMYDIYGQASRVVVWLGLHGDDSELAILAVKFLRSQSNRQLITRSDHDLECIQGLERIILSLEALLQRSWFSRSWVRQEIATARKINVKCGNDEITWTALKKAVNCLGRLREKVVNNSAVWEYQSSLPQRDIPRQSTLRFLKRHAVVGQSLLAGVADLRSVWYYHSGGLLEYLMISRAFEATDPRDRVYSVLGMTNTPVENELMEEDLERSMAALTVQDKQEPSRSSKTPEESAERREDLVSPASPQAVSQIPKILVDYSATVSQVYQHVAKYIINTHLTLDILTLISTHRSPTGASQDLPSWTPDWRVPTGEIGLSENLEYLRFKFGAAGFTKCLPQDQNDLGRLLVQGFQLDVVTELVAYGVESIPHPPEQPVGTLAIFDSEIHLRRLCNTTKLQGFCPRETAVHDEVWILYGCRTPMVLRRVEGGHELRWSVVGPCYLPSMMWGRGLKEFLEAGDELQTIVLI